MRVPSVGIQIDAHVVWDADETFDGWAHCTIGTGDSDVHLLREWPRLTDDSDDRLRRGRAGDRPPAAARLAVRRRRLRQGPDRDRAAAAGFVAYQLWGTGIEARPRPERPRGGVRMTLLPRRRRRRLTSTTAITPASSTSHGTAPCRTRCSTSRPAGDTLPAPTSRFPIAEGDPVARLEIPEIGVDVVVVAGVSVDDLRRGPGHYPDTPLPGQSATPRSPATA